MAQPGRSPLSRVTGKLKTIGPYAIALAALAWVLHHTDRHQFWMALQHAPILWFLAISAVMMLLTCAADTFAMISVFGWFGCRIPYRDLYVVRASTYLLAIVNYHVGQAAIVGFLYRVWKVPLVRATGFILFIIGVNIVTLFLLASAGASRATGSLHWLRLVPLVCVAGGLAYAGLLKLAPRFLTERALFAPLFQMGIVGHIKGIVVRLPHIGVLLAWHFIALRMFGVKVPPLAALLYLPAYFAVGNLPINVNGLGVSQLVAVAFFARYGTEASVMAYSLSIAGVSIVLQLLLGFACLRRAAALGLSTEEVVAPDEEEAQAEGRAQVAS